MNKITRKLRVLFTPACWFQCEKYNAQWDLHLRTALFVHHFRPYHDATAGWVWLGPYLIWVGCHPFGSFDPCREQDYGFCKIPQEIHLRPSRATILEAGDKLRRDLHRVGIYQLGDFR